MLALGRTRGTWWFSAPGSLCTQRSPANRAGAPSLCNRAGTGSPRLCPPMQGPWASGREHGLLSALSLGFPSQTGWLAGSHGELLPCASSACCCPHQRGEQRCPSQLLAPIYKSTPRNPCPSGLFAPSFKTAPSSPCPTLPALAGALGLHQLRLAVLSLRGSDLFFGKAEILKKLTFCLGQFKTGLQQPWGSQQRGRGDAAPVAGWERAPAARRVHAALGLLWDRGCKKLQSGHEGSRVNIKLSIPHWEVICSQKDASAFKKKIY